MELAPLRDGIGFYHCELTTYVSAIAQTFYGFESLFTAGTLTGFDASGHVAEETKHARLVFAPKPIFKF
jgi:hypothetical protein